MKKIFLFLFCVSIFICFFSCSSAPKNETNSVAAQPINEDTSTVPRDPFLQDRFMGTVRSDVKTSYVNVAADTFTSIKKLVEWLPTDEYMHESTEAKKNNSPRTKEENHNVYLEDLYVYGIKKEDDNDYHLILASSKKLDKEQKFFSAEISGLPDSTSEFYAKLAAVRKIFLAYFGNSANRELVFVASEKNPPIHLDYVSGSLFFDNHHYGGHSSVQGYKVCSAWEIHPVTSIGFHN